MKKVWLALSLSLALCASASAAVPQEGYYLGKDGAPLTVEQQTPPAVKSTKMAPQNQAVHDAMAALPHSTSAVLRLTITEDGNAANPEVIQSSGSIILDQYAMESVNFWTFRPAKLGEKAISMTVSVPIRFVSTMIAVPAAPTAQPMKDMSDEVRAAAERNNHPELSVKVYINAAGAMEGKPEIEKADHIPASDFKLLSKYAENCVKSWTFSAAQNPDGEAIGAEVIVTVQL